MDETYWHGGPAIRGDSILPPSVTGAARVCHGEPWVYLTPLRSLALTYAATCNGWLYEVAPLGPVEQDPDSMPPLGHSVRCREARIVRRFRPSREEADAARGAVASFGWSGVGGGRGE
jgi:hypothetical protein